MVKITGNTKICTCYMCKFILEQNCTNMSMHLKLCHPKVAISIELHVTSTVMALLPSDSLFKHLLVKWVWQTGGCGKLSSHNSQPFLANMHFQTICDSISSQNKLILSSTYSTYINPKKQKFLLYATRCCGSSNSM